MEAGDAIQDVVGPLGKPSVIEKFGTVVVVGGGVGTALAYPTTAALKRAGNRVLSIVGGRNRDLVILEEEMRAVSDELYVTTDDGSYGEKGLVTDKLRQLLESEIQLVLAVGPIPMMKAVADLTRERGVHTVVSLNPIMIDGTGMCGGCRVLVGGKSRFACVDGPEFNAHEVDFEVLMQRNRMYRDAEKRSLEEYLNRLPGGGESEEPSECMVGGGKQ
jgi:ferredoxin--NADP+ reductase